VEIDVNLRVAPSKSFRCQKAANSLDINTKEKLTHSLHVEADLETDYRVGVVVGASGSGKTTLAQHVWGNEALERSLKPNKPVLDQFPKGMSYDECVRLLTGVGLTSVPCWIRPAWTLSNGQRERAEIALKMATAGEFAVIDEWTSVVDRTVAKVMSHCIAKWARKTKRKIVLLTCHYDVVEWLAPDWVIDCNRQAFDDRRSLQPARKETLRFEIAECDRATWKAFSKYHYLSDRLPSGRIWTFGVYHEGDQIGFVCYANYVPKRAGKTEIVHMNRIVIHPDYVGLGLGIWTINETSAVMFDRGFDVHSKFSSKPVFIAMSRDPNWTFLGKKRDHKILVGGNMVRDAGFRLDVTTYRFRYEPCQH
jgi:ABC-type dipeptide/oligopeptide/nickel transport system ATPase subunit